jgi:rfaE bifunctional protein kinase chain/domain
VIRIDRGASSSAPAADADVVSENALALLRDGAKALLISDYGFGSAAPRSARPLIEEVRRLGLVVTCDSRHRLKEYRGVSAVTPNLEEAEELLGTRLGTDRASLEPAARRLLEELGCVAVLITRGRTGMTILEDGVKPFDIPVFGSDQVSDVTGAGDTVIAAFTLALAAGATYRQAAILANCAAGLVVMKRGTATVSSQELAAAVDRLPDPAPDAP